TGAKYRGAMSKAPAWAGACSFSVLRHNDQPVCSLRFSSRTSRAPPGTKAPGKGLISTIHVLDGLVVPPLSALQPAQVDRIIPDPRPVDVLVQESDLVAVNARHNRRVVRRPELPPGAAAVLEAARVELDNFPRFGHDVLHIPLPQCGVVLAPAVGVNS